MSRRPRTGGLPRICTETRNVLRRSVPGKSHIHVPPRTDMVAAVVLIRASPGDIPSLARRIAGVDGVAEVYSVSGEYDLIAIVRVPEYERVAQVVTEDIAKISGIERTNTLTAFRVYSKQDLERAWDMFD
jgi:DNA-binding Lrp family transcriptional regulator